MNIDTLCRIIVAMCRFMCQCARTLVMSSASTDPRTILRPLMKTPLWSWARIWRFQRPIKPVSSFLWENLKKRVLPQRKIWLIVIAPDTLSQATFLRYISFPWYLSRYCCDQCPLHSFCARGSNLRTFNVSTNSVDEWWDGVLIPAYSSIFRCVRIYIYMCVYLNIITVYTYTYVRKSVSMYQFSGRLATFWYCTVFNCYQGSLVWKTWSATKTTATCVIGEKVGRTEATKTRTVVFYDSCLFLTLFAFCMNEMVLCTWHPM